MKIVPRDCTAIMYKLKKAMENHVNLDFKIQVGFFNPNFVSKSIPNHVLISPNTEVYIQRGFQVDRIFKTENFVFDINIVLRDVNDEQFFNEFNKKKMIILTDILGKLDVLDEKIIDCNVQVMYNLYDDLSSTNVYNTCTLTVTLQVGQ